MGDPVLWGSGLIGLALALAILEVFIPSGGLIGMAAGVIALAGVVAFWTESWLLGVASLAATIVAGVALFQFALKVMPYTPVGRGLLLNDAPDAEANRYAAEHDRHEAERALVGAEGVAVTDLRPVGAADIDGERVEVLAEGGAIGAGRRIRVTRVEANQIKVRPAD